MDVNPVESFNINYNLSVWFDIPVVDLDRAIAFYARVLDTDVVSEVIDGIRYGLIRSEFGNGGCLMVDEIRINSQQGPLIYLNVYGRLAQAVDRVTDMGGAVLEGIHPLGRWGHRAIILDSEGNRLALHSF